MELVLIGFIAFLASGLTLFSGFGLGTVLMPVFALFFPVSLAIGATAMVHFANNIFKFGLMAKQANWQIVARFSIPATLTALVGALLLNMFERMPLLGSYALGGSIFEITVVKAVIGTLIVLFALLELSPWFQELVLPPRWLPFGGALSGFFGGLSGNQGALRSAFLITAGFVEGSFHSYQCSFVSPRRCNSLNCLRNGISICSFYKVSGTYHPGHCWNHLRVCRNICWQTILAKSHAKGCSGNGCGCDVDNRIRSPRGLCVNKRLFIPLLYSPSSKLALLVLQFPRYFLTKAGTALQAINLTTWCSR